MNTSLIASTSSTKTVNTTCCYCGVGCGVTATLENNKLVSVQGDPHHPANSGRLCVKGSALHESQASDKRLYTPLLKGKPSSWESALHYSADRFKAIVDQHGPDSVAFYVSGQLLTEDYYVANKLMKGFIGSSNIDTNSRLCMASAVVAHKRAFGEDLVPGCYDDLEQCDLLLLVGSNMAYTHPVIYQRIAKAKQQRPEMTIVVIDPRRTPSCDIADIHLAIRPGADAFFFNGLLAYLASHQALDNHFIEQHSNHFNEALSAAQAQVGGTHQAAHLCDLNRQTLESVYALFAKQQKVVSVFSQGINQSSSGVDKGNAIINCHLASGKIGKPGASPFSITGQPNAMGGREVGGLANQLAAHMNFGDAAALSRVQRFWKAPNISQEEGLKAVELFKAVHSGKIKAIWIMATNPVVTMPDANFVRDALRRCELVIVSDCMANTDTVREADVVFPATTWGEKTGTVTNSERCISLQKGFLPAPGEAKDDWEIISAFAQQLGFRESFNYTSPADIFREHAALSGYENCQDNTHPNARCFDISALQTISDYDYFNFKPTFWPIDKNSGSGIPRLFKNSQFYTPDGKANFVAVSAQFPKKAPKNGQLIMNTGRIRDQWHTMARTASTAKLMAHCNEAFVDMHPADAHRHALEDHDLVELNNRGARYLARINISNTVRVGEIFVPMHWNNNYASSSRAGALINDITDPLCGQPEFKHTPVAVTPYKAKWQGLLLSTIEQSPISDYWSKITLANGFKYRIADTSVPDNWPQWIRQQYPQVEQWSELHDSDNHHYRAMGYIEDQLAIALLVSTQERPLRHENLWLEAQLGTLCNSDTRFALLAGAANDDAKDLGKIVCSCFQVGENTLREAINAGAHSQQALAETLHCGSNCGSCIPELNTLISQTLDAGDPTNKTAP